MSFVGKSENLSLHRLAGWGEATDQAAKSMRS